MRDLNDSNKIMEISKNERLPLDILRLDVTDDNSLKKASVKYMIKITGLML